MKTTMPRSFLIATIAVAIAGASCHKEAAVATNAATTDNTAALKAMVAENGANPDDIMLSAAQTETSSGYVYTESNDAAQNKILLYKQKADGKLSWMAATASGGAGNSSGLGSQGAVIMNAQHQLLFAVNAGDNTISSFMVHSDGSLTLAHTVSSYGVTPVSLTCNGNLLYVVNAGSDNIYGYYVGAGGSLTPIQGSWQSLSGTGSGPAEIKFQPDGYALFVTEKNTNKIASFGIAESGAAIAGKFFKAVGTTPFGFEFAGDKHFMIVSNTAGGAENMGTCTSYITSGGTINDVNGAVADHQSAPCWVAPAYHGRYAYTTNTASNTISVYYVSPMGDLYLLPFAKTAAGAGPIDIVVSSNNRYVYNLNSVSHTVSEYKRSLLGTLNPMGEVSGLPPYAAGLACY